MKRRSGLKYLLIAVFAGLFSCKSNIICPAFQSTYILDDSLRLMAFSPFGADMQPKAGPNSRKNKNGIIAHQPYLVKNYQLRVVRMENQFLPPLADSALLAGPEPMPIAADSLTGVDSALLDKPATAPVPAKESRYIRGYDPKEKYNEEQDFYNKHFGELFIRKDPPPAKTVSPAGLPSDSTEVQDQKRGLFNRKKANETDELPLQPADSTGN